MAKLIVTTPYDTFEVMLRSDVTIGRSRSNTLRLDGAQVSRNHAVMFRREGQWQIRDLDSRNGLFVNGASVAYARLKDGDIVTIGEFEIRFLSEATSAYRLRTLHENNPEDASEITSNGDPSKVITFDAAPRAGHQESQPNLPEIFFRLEEVERMADRWDGTSPNQFLHENLGLHQRLMTTDRVGADMAALTRHLLFSLSHAVGATRGVILQREESGMLLPLASEPAAVSLTVSRIVADAALRKLCTLCKDCTSDPRFRYSRSIHTHNVSSLLCVPLVRGDEVSGMIYLDTTERSRPFRREHLHLACFIGRMACLFEELQVAATGRPVTPPEDRVSDLTIDSAPAQGIISEFQQRRGDLPTAAPDETASTPRESSTSSSSSGM